MELNTAIDRQSYVPLYVQVKDSLRDLIPVSYTHLDVYKRQAPYPPVRRPRV